MAYHTGYRRFVSVCCFVKQMQSTHDETAQYAEVSVMKRMCDEARKPKPKPRNNPAAIYASIDHTVMINCNKSRTHSHSLLVHAELQ